MALYRRVFRLLPALLIAIATACFGLYPSRLNIRILLLTAFLLAPFFSGITSPIRLGVPVALMEAWVALPLVPVALRPEVLRPVVVPVDLPFPVVDLPFPLVDLPFPVVDLPWVVPMVHLMQAGASVAFVTPLLNQLILRDALSLPAPLNSPPTHQLSLAP